MTLLHPVVWLTQFKRYPRIKVLFRIDITLDVGNIKVQELTFAIIDVVRIAQTEGFGAKNHNRLDGSYTYLPPMLRKLKPLNIDGVLYLGGRVTPRATDQRLPILPSKGRITDLLIMYYHIMCDHSGASYVLASIRRAYCIVHGMAAAKRVLSKCMECRLLHAPHCRQAMAPLPSFRTRKPSYPFSHSGVDYFGPFMVKCNRSEVKRFGCLFTCMQTRAVHIEVAHGMTTDSFLMALDRFISRRGIPKVLYSDNGSNFIGAEAELRSLCKSFDNKRIHDALLVYQIEWQFNPPSASHRGGVWERMIRTVRKVLSHLVKEQKVSDEGLLTCLAEAERIVNDRPLVPVYDEPELPIALLPNDWLLLRPNPGLTVDSTPLRERFTKQWRQAQHLANTFWKRWKREYLPTLQVTQKWLNPQRNLKLGDLVLLSKIDTPRGCWSKGVVKETYPGLDGLTRQVLVKTVKGLVLRDVRSLCLLEGAEE
ncbi:DDE-type integrase/transposase/recombinase [Streptococcus dysgalactiae subsp. equisimilis]|nr:DDE-type integrase/transposase/recombinase [Streptococcus dysgalactiae subsp. equisimilis]